MATPRKRTRKPAKPKSDVTDAGRVGSDGPEGPATAAPKETVRDEQIAFLGDLIANRLGLYRHRECGYGGVAGRPRWSDDFVGAAVELGLACHEPSGGAHGSVKITDVGRAAYKRLRQTPAAADAEAG